MSEPMTIEALSEALAQAVGAEHRAAGAEMRLFAIDGVIPQAAAFPGSYDEVSRVMRLAAEHRLAVTASGGGTILSMGNPPERVDILLGTGRLDRIVEHAAKDLTVTVEAGITLQRLEEALAPFGQSVGLDAPLAGRATVGGILAANVAGPRRLGYGGPRDRLIGIRVADAKGTLIKAGGKVVKNVAGYDLGKMFIGSLGTLGVIVEATFKLAPVPPARATMVGAFAGLEQAMAAAQAVRSGWCRPVALDLLNRTAFDAVSVRAGVPSIPDGQYMVVADLAGGPAAVERQKTDIHLAVADNGGKSLLVAGEPQYGAFWRALLDMGRQDDLPASMITRCSALFSRMPAQVHGHEAMAEGGSLNVAIDAQLASGVIRAFWWDHRRGAAGLRRTGEAQPENGHTPADGEAPGHSDLLADTARTLRVAAGHAEGSLVIESCSAAVKRSIDAWGPAGPGFPIMQKLKKEFDPDRILSPGRFVGGI